MSVNLFNSPKLIYLQLQGFQHDYAGLVYIPTNAGVAA